jgi:CRISPR-associated protein Cmr6
MSNNIGYLYNKGYLKKLRTIDSVSLKELIDINNKKIFDAKITKWDYLRFDDDKAEDRARAEDNGITRFQLATVYPGLLIGSGYNHDVNFDELGKSFDGSKEASFKIGFSFDHISGMPFIPGSSIKGMLRSFFPNEYKKDREIENQECKKEYILDLLNADKKPTEEDKKFTEEDRKPNEEEKEFTKEDIDEIEEVIFSGVNKDGSRVESYRRDIFFDAIPLCIENNQESNPKTLFGPDYITPHVDKNGDPAPTKNPVPIKFLKINPNVVYQFSFRFSDSTLSNGVLTKTDKEELFKKILSQSGLGAKTAVGYGQFVITPNIKAEENRIEEMKKKEEEEKVKIKNNERIFEDAREKKENLIKIEAEQKNRRHREAREQGLSKIIKLRKIEEVIKKLEPWAKAYYANPKVIKELKGRVIPKELHQEFESYIQSIYDENICKDGFRKRWPMNIEKLKDFDSDLNIMEE